jgi:hypothetical protein
MYTNKIKNEIFSKVCSILTETGFSSNLRYILFKKKLSGFFVINSNSKTFNLKLKLTKSNYKMLNNAGQLVGYYRALW